MYSLYVITDDTTDDLIVSWSADNKIKCDYHRAFTINRNLQWVSKYTFKYKEDAAFFKLSFECEDV